MKARSSKAGTTRTTRRRAAPKPKATPPAAGDSRTVITEDERRRMIAEAAYLRAAGREFASGAEVEDWLAAEREVDALLEARRSGRRAAAGASAGPVTKRLGPLVETPPADATAR